jgi:diguanylate cyclase (GGDEF)-like protein
MATNPDELSIKLSAFSQHHCPESYLIMVVDDISQNLHLLDQILNTAGYNTTFCTDGQQALERLQFTQPDLILLDLMMPDLSGIDVCKAIRAHPEQNELPIIFITASNEREHLLEAFEQGANDYVTKPVHALELLARVKTHLSLRQSQKNLRMAYQQLEQLAMLDPLTEVANRRALTDAAETEFKRVERYNGIFAVMMVDLDYFKTVNDTYGHQTGDECLKLIAQTLKAHLRDVDHVGRFGGEEFMVILPETDIDQALVLGERLRHQVVHLCPKINQRLVNLSISIGISVYHKADKSVQDIWQRADKALYQSKSAGRNRVCYLVH